MSLDPRHLGATVRAVKKRVRRSKEEAQSIILDATEALILEGGPDSFRVTEVAEKAGMHQTNVFHHFGSREGLMQALVARLLDDGAKRALRAFGEALGAGPDERKEALARVFDVIQEKGVGKLYGWLLLSGRLDRSVAPDFSPMLNGMRAWRSAAFQDRLASQDDKVLKQLLYLITVVWLGDAIGGTVMARGVGYEDPEAARREFRRWLSEMVIGWMERQADA